jgi:LysR family transcriptional regulator, hydrogen peroxide-inducible genes activator
MEMHQVRYFLAVARELNFTRAAESCHVAQPSLTRAIKLLEEELGGPLFHRERLNTHLSELGRMVKPHLDQLWGEAQATKRLADGFRKMERSKLRLGVMCTIAPSQLVDLIVALQTRHPGVELDIIDDSARALNERLLAGQLEAALYCLAGRPDDERTHRLPLFQERMMIVINPAHRLAANNAIRVKDLHGERYLERIKCEFGGVAGAAFEEQGVQDETIYRCERDDWILAMAAAGLGYAFMPESSVTHPGVVARPLVEPEFWREVSLVTVRGRPHTPALGAFVREAMRANWLGKAAIGLRRAEER